MVWAVHHHKGRDAGRLLQGPFYFLLVHSLGVLVSHLDGDVQVRGFANGQNVSADSKAMKVTILNCCHRNMKTIHFKRYLATVIYDSDVLGDTMDAHADVFVLITTVI